MAAQKKKKKKFLQKRNQVLSNKKHACENFANKKDTQNQKMFLFNIDCGAGKNCKDEKTDEVDLNTDKTAHAPIFNAINSACNDSIEKKIEKNNFKNDLKNISQKNNNNVNKKTSDNAIKNKNNISKNKKNFLRKNIRSSDNEILGSSCTIVDKKDGQENNGVNQIKYEFVDSCHAAVGDKIKDEGKITRPNDDIELEVNNIANVNINFKKGASNDNNENPELKKYFGQFQKNKRYEDKQIRTRLKLVKDLCGGSDELIINTQKCIECEKKQLDGNIKDKIEVERHTCNKDISTLDTEEDKLLTTEAFNETQKNQEVQVKEKEEIKKSLVGDVGIMKESVVGKGVKKKMSVFSQSRNSVSVLHSNAMAEAKSGASVRRKKSTSQSSGEKDRTTVMLVVVVLSFVLVELPQGVLALLSAVRREFFEQVHKLYS